ncbi:MAG: T9SS type A sorting domain-containing protein [candidate division Zixibacteria bacterium]|nr:T9SS type A sorting domain-containing protein [candidate division Zixibacteria bacterium]
MQKQIVTLIVVALAAFTMLLAPSSVLAIDGAKPVPGVAPGNYDPTGVIGSIEPFASEIGMISWSIDGLGTTASSGIIKVDKPEDATVRSAYFFSATTGFTDYQLQDGDVQLEGNNIVWDDELMSSIESYNYMADVTDIVAPIVDAAPAGIVELTINENNSANIDGEVLAVIFDDPNVTETATIALLFGAQAIEGDEFNIGLAEPVTEETNVYMSLGISYGYQPTEQVSHIDVNGERLTSSAGGQDDGEDNNGALITVGGIDDSMDNPPDPYGEPDTPRYDDELYTLNPYLEIGETSINVYTINPSDDDNIFFGAFHISGAAVVGEGAVLTPEYAEKNVGEMHMITATLQDDDGNPIADREINFHIVDGPHSPMDYTDATNEEGKAFFEYEGMMEGSDIIMADFINSQGEYQEAENEAVVDWITGGDLCCDVELSPDDGDPVIVNPPDIFRFTATLCNPNEEPIFTDFWTVTESMGERWEILVHTDVEVGGDDCRNGRFIQWICGQIEPCVYVYTAYCGDYETGEICDSASFEVVVLNGEGITNMGNVEELWLSEGGFNSEEFAMESPAEYTLSSNYPNPFNAQTNISFSLPEAGNVRLNVYNLLGQNVATLVDGNMSAGQHTVNWDAANHASGVYLYKLQANDQVITKKMHLLK